ncbi:uncharacterized protein [Palaemon carinicauda]|uniref:uncharacterized protein n=1 Tax=Palaemon carinicauda TaxID=392227 RepID=UPI0035B62D6A
MGWTENTKGASRLREQFCRVRSKNFYGHDVCRVHARCAVTQGALKYWDPQPFGVTLQIKKEDHPKCGSVFCNVRSKNFCEHDLCRRHAACVVFKGDLRYWDTQPPKSFNPPQGSNHVQAWQDWKEQFDLYLIAAEKTAATDPVKICIGILKYAMGPEWIKVAKNFTFTEAGDDQEYDIVIQKFDEYFQPKNLLKAYETIFHQRVQGPTESLNDYIAAVCELTSQCEFGATVESQVCIQISNGVRDKKLKEKQWEDDLSLNDIIKKCNQYDQLQETRSITGEAQVNAAAFGRGGGRSRGRRGRQGGSQSHAPSQGRGQAHQGQSRGQAYQGQVQGRGRGNLQGRGRGNFSNSNCGNCGRGHPPRQCPAFGQTCNACGRKSHFARCCRLNSVRYADEQPQDTQINYEKFSDTFNALNVGSAVYASNSVYMSHPDFLVDLQVQGCQTIRFRIDTVAATSILGHRAYNSLSRKPTLKRGGLPVYNEDVPNLLSVADSVRMNLVKRIFNVNTTNLLLQYSDVFNGTGKIPGDYSLQIAPDTQPVALNARPIPAALREPKKTKLNELEKLGIIVEIPVGEPTPWCSALHVVPKKKKDSDKVNEKVEVRVTIDPQHLNRALKCEYHPITTIEDVITRTDGSKFFTLLDANQGYFQIGLDLASQRLTAFNTPFGRYMYKRLPMGISSAPEIYQLDMNDMFSDFD